MESGSQFLYQGQSDGKEGTSRCSAGKYSRPKQPNSHGVFKLVKSMKSTFCDLDLFIAEMFNCCVLSNDPSVQQDCLCDPVAYGMAPESTDNVGVDGEAALGVRRAGPSNLGISKSKLGAEEKYKSPGCRVDGYCDTPHDETDAMWAVCCQDEWRNVPVQPHGVSHLVM